MHRKCKFFTMMLLVFFLTSCSIKDSKNPSDVLTSTNPEQPTLPVSALQPTETTPEETSPPIESSYPNEFNPMSPEDYIIKPFVGSRNIGSAKTFHGKCVFVNIFLSDQISTFDDTAKLQAIEKLQSVENYFLQQSKKYNHNLSMIYNEEDLMIHYEVDFMIPFDMNDSDWSRGIVSQVLSNEQISAIKEKYEADNIAFLLHINKEGYSYACYQERKAPELNEYCVLYATEDVTFYSHEILHLFGAVDLYFPNDPNNTRKRLAEIYFPDDIMISSYRNINEATIGDLDAYLIGWSEYLQMEYIIFIKY